MLLRFHPLCDGVAPGDCAHANRNLVETWEAPSILVHFDPCLTSGLPSSLTTNQQ